MTGGRSLVGWILCAAGTHDWLEFKYLPGGFTNQLIRPTLQETGIPERFAFFSDQDLVAQLQVNYWVEQSLAEGNIVWIGQYQRLREFGQCTMAGFALDVLDLLFIAIQTSIPHYLGAGMAVDAVECIFAFCELGNGLVVIVQAVGGSILARLEGN